MNFRDSVEKILAEFDGVLNDIQQNYIADAVISAHAKWCEEVLEGYREYNKILSGSLSDYVQSCETGLRVKG